MNVSKRSAIVLAIVSSCLAPEAGAVDRSWIETGGGLNNWNDAANWNPGDEFAKAGDNATFDPDATYTVILQVSAADDVTFSNGNVTLGGGTLNTGGVATIDDIIAAGLDDGAIVTVSGPAWDNVGDAVVGDSGFGQLTIDSDGDFRSQDFFIGDDLGAVGEVTVHGVGSSLTTDGTENTNGYFIGNAGVGTLNITDGGLARILPETSGSIADVRLGVTPDGEGNLNITGEGSSAIAEDVWIGLAGSGELNITGGGAFNQNIGASPDAFIAYDAGSTGDVIVHGDGSEWSMAHLRVGNLGDATLSIEAGGLVQNTMAKDVVLGHEGGSGRIAVYDSDVGISTLSVTNDLWVGNTGLGVLHVGQDLAGAPDGAGSLSVGSDLFIGAVVGNNFDNKVVIDGADATANISVELQAGVYGKGTFEARGGATVTVGGAVWAGIYSDASGTILVDGGSTTLTAQLLIAGNGFGNGSIGDVTVSDGAVVTLTGADVPGVAAAVTLGDDGLGVGVLTVTGADSKVETTNAAGGWWIGGSMNEPGGTGTVNILDGAQGISAARVVVAYEAGAKGTLDVDGTGSQLDANGDYLLVGFKGLGNAEVTNGGRINANRILVADAPGSVGSELIINGRNNGTASTVDIGGLLHVGDSSRGTVEVSGGAQLSVASDGGADRLIIGDEGAADGSRLTVTGVGSRVDYFGTGDVAVGNAGGSSAERAQLVVTGGGVFSAVQRDGGNNIVSQARINIGDTTGGNGQIVVDGDDSLVEAEAIHVGDGHTGSSGILDLLNGGTVTTTGALVVASYGVGNGDVFVDGATSTLNVGISLSLGAGTGAGTLLVSAGGAVNNGGQAYIGSYNGSTGTASVGGTESTWTIGGELTLAGTETVSQTSGSGVLNVDPGGLVDVASNLRIRNLGDVNLDGGELRVGGDLLFTDAGSTFNFYGGKLRFTEPTGTTLDANLLERIFGGGPQTLTDGKTLTVDGTAQLTGALRVNGGTFRVGDISTDDVANVDFDAGTFDLTASSLVVDLDGLFGASLVLDGDETVNVVDNATTITTDASLNVIGGGFTNASAINDGLVVVSQTDAVDFDSDDSGTGLTNNGQLVLIDSTVGGPVTGSGAIEIVGAAGVGALTLASGASLGIDIGGAGAGEFDTLAVGGAASVAGELMINLAAGYTPTAGDTFEVLSASSLADNGIVLTGDTAGFSLLTTSTSLLLQFLPGDYNDNGAVEQGDLDLVLLNWGTTWPPEVPGWINDQPTDGAINQDDLDGVLLNWGNTFASSGVVPEPTSVLLVLVGVGIAGLQRCPVSGPVSKLFSA